MVNHIFLKETGNLSISFIEVLKINKENLNQRKITFDNRIIKKSYNFSLQRTTGGANSFAYHKSQLTVIREICFCIKKHSNELISTDSLKRVTKMF